MVHLPRQVPQETWVQPLGWEDSLEKEMATHSSILGGIIPQTEETGRLQSMGSQRVEHDQACTQAMEFYATELYNFSGILCVDLKLN